MVSQVPLGEKNIIVSVMTELVLSLQRETVPGLQK